jgi:hypothetical protein
MEKYEIVIIGASQVELAMEDFLQQTNASFVLLDSHNQIGDWDSCRLM